MNEDQVSMNQNNNSIQNPTPIQNPNTPEFNAGSFAKNDKFINTVKTMAIYTPILTIVGYITTMIMYGFKYGVEMGWFSVTAVISAVISGIVGGAISGAVFYFIYDPVRNWIKGNSFLSNYIHSVFTLFWIPTLAFFIVSSALGLLGLMGGGIIGSISLAYLINLIINLVAAYFYSKFISSKLEAFYPW